jgi:WD40 repeat protein
MDLDYCPTCLGIDSSVVLNVVMKLGTNEDRLYFCRNRAEVTVIELSNIKGFYAKPLPAAELKTSSNVLCLDVSDDGTLLSVGCESGSVSLIHTDSCTTLQSTEQYSSRPIILTFGIKRKYLAGGFDDNSVRVWNLDSALSLKYEFNKHTDLISGIAFVNDNRYLVTSSFDNNVSIWDMKVESLPYSLNLYDNKVICFKSSRDGKKVYFSQSRNSVLVWEIPHLHKNARYRKHLHAVNKLIFLPNCFELLSIGSDGQAVLWDFRNDLMQESITLDGNLTNAAIPSDGEYVMITSSKPCIYRWDFKTGVVDEFEFTSTGLTLEFSSDNYTLAVSDSLNRVIVYDADVMERKFILKSHRAHVTALAFIQEDKFLLSASLDNEITKWTLENGERLSVFRGHLNPISAMIVSPESFVISASDEAIIVWNLDGVLIYRMEIRESDAGRIVGLYVSNDNRYLVALQENRVNYWQMDNLSIMFQTDTMEPAHFLAVSRDERFLAVAEGATVFVEENPLNSTSLRIVGKNIGSRHKYMNFIIESQEKDSRAEYSQEYNNWVAVPYMIGVSHVLSFSNRIENLNEALNIDSNKAGYFSTINWENPLSLAIDLEYKNIIDVCLKFMKGELTRGNIRAFASIERCLTALNKIEYPDISKVYDLILYQAEGEHLPAFCLHETELPVLHPSEHLVIIPEEIVGKEFFSSTGRPVVFHQSLCLLDLEMGTASSLDFLQSLLDYGDDKVYNTRIVKEFLTCKWDQITPVVNTQGCLYIIYMFFLSIYTVNFMQDRTFFLLVLFMHLVLFSIELLQLFTDLRNYFWDVWNVIDVLRTSSFFFYTFNFYMYEEGCGYDCLLAVIVFSWLRGISYFRMFTGTRYMVRLLGMVILDMRVFFTILAYSTVGFSFIFYLRNPETEFFIYLMTSYRLDLGDFNTDYTVVFDWVVFFLATMMNPMIMLNLLISILSDTAARVSADNYTANLRELTKMIIEIEKVMFWKKNMNVKHHLHICNFTEDDEIPDKMLEKCKYIKGKLDKMHRKLEVVNSRMEGVNIAHIEGTVKYMIQEQEKIKQEMNANFEVNNNMLAKIGERIGLS